MPEQWFRQIDYKVDYICDKCKKGKMVPLLPLERKRHKCQECNYTKDLKGIYPMAFHKPMTKIDKRDR